MRTLKNYQPGDTVIEEGTKGTSAFVVLSGAVEVIKRSGKQEVSVATLGERQVFGEMGLIEDKPRSATVRAITELKVQEINRDDFNELLKTKPSVLIPIMKSLFERLRQASDRLAEMGADSVTGRQGERAFEVIMSGQTSEARKALDDRRLLITKFPFLIGRAYESADADVFYNNDFFIFEHKPFVISRNHLAVSNEGGMMWIVDRGSAFGTIVNGREIGGETGVTRVPLDKEENQVIIGPATSTYIFLLQIVPL